MPTTLDDRIDAFLRDLHAIEEQALQQLEQAPELAGSERFADALRRHEKETRGHERRVREQLEARGSSPSKLEDAVFRAGGEGFVLFARSQTDTPGKLASHALSYEALEWAGYDLLARVAERADAPEVARLARDIREEERAMMQRIEGLFDDTVEASLEATLGDDLGEHLGRYLADAHALEAQSIQLLEDGRNRVDSKALADVFDEHLATSRGQQERLERRLEALGSDPSVLKDAALRLGAVNWGMFFGLQPDTTPKLAAFAYAFEHLEIAGYEQLRRVALRAGDTETADAAAGILAEERAAAEKIHGSFDEAAATVT